MDAVLEKNWLISVSNTLANMELNDDLKLKVVTRLIDKSAATFSALKVKKLTSERMS